MTRPSLTEAEFAAQVTDLATLLGWSAAHFRPAQTSKGWRTPVSGSLGKGWPDYVFAHPTHGVLFRELKRDGGNLTGDQLVVIALLRRAGANVAVWRPRDMDSGRIERELRGAK